MKLILFYFTTQNLIKQSEKIIKNITIEKFPTKQWTSKIDLITSHILTNNNDSLLILKGELKKWNEIITDSEIAQALIRSHQFKLNKTLDSLGVWYYSHAQHYSIADVNGTVKLYRFEIEGSIFKRIIINYRHDNIEQPEDLKQIQGYSEKRIGIYSTDVFFDSN